MKFTLEIELGNDAMQYPEQVGEAIHIVAKDLIDEFARFEAPFEETIQDTDGNTVGKWEVVETPAPRKTASPESLFRNLSQPLKIEVRRIQDAYSLTTTDNPTRKRLAISLLAKELTDKGASEVADWLFSIYA